MEKLWALLSLFRKGNAVADPELWKNGGITAATITGLLYAIIATAKSFGYEIPINESDVGGIAIGVLSVGHVVLTLVTSTKVGLAAKNDIPPDNSAVIPEPPTAEVIEEPKTGAPARQAIANTRETVHPLDALTQTGSFSGFGNGAN